MFEHPLDFLADCQDVPIECSNCHHLTTLGVKGDAPVETIEDAKRGLCDCDAGFRVYVGDAPGPAAIKLAMLMDLIDSMTDEEREAWVDSVRDDLGEE